MQIYFSYKVRKFDNSNIDLNKKVKSTMKLESSTKNNLHNEENDHKGSNI